MNWKTIEVEFLDGGVVLVTLNRPDVLNAVDETMRGEFTSLIPVLQEEAVRAVVFSGAGRAFCAGVDISRFEQDWSNRYFAGENYDLLDFFDALENLPKPVFAAINGAATGAGILLALACDIRVASEAARVGFREHRLGLVPGLGGSVRLVRLLGLARAKEIYFQEELVPAKELHRLGLVARITTPETLIPETLHWARELAARAPLALARAELLFNGVAERTHQEAIEAENEALEASVRSEDHKEGIAAFRERRRPVFRGR